VTQSYKTRLIHAISTLMRQVKYANAFKYEFIWDMTHAWVMFHMNESPTRIMTWSYKTWLSFTKHANVFKYAQLCKSFKCNTVDSCHQHVDKFNARVFKYEVAAVSRIDKTIGLFCRISSLLCGSFAKETYDFIHPTKWGHPICTRLQECKWVLFNARMSHVLYDGVTSRS